MTGGGSAGGEVYRATEPTLQRDVLVKALDPRLSQKAENVREFDDRAIAIVALQHPTLQTIWSLGTCEETGRRFCVLPDAPRGSSIEDLVDQRTPLDFVEALSLGFNLLSMLAHVESLGL